MNTCCTRQKRKTGGQPALAMQFPQEICTVWLKLSCVGLALKLDFLAVLDIVDTDVIATGAATSQENEPRLSTIVDC